MELQRLSWQQVEERTPKVAVLPVGSTEQHGPHNPLGTDATLASELARSACETTDALLLPPIHVGLAEHHRNFPGTLFVSHDTLRDYVREVLQSVARHSPEAAVVVNGHGGNTPAVDEACARVSRDEVIYATVWEWFAATDVDVGHGGEAETSLNMYLTPEDVGEPVEGDAPTWGKYVNGAAVAHDTEEFTANGITGDARNASAEIGQELFDESTAALTEVIEWVRENRV